jgi:hypothetical protein
VTKNIFILVGAPGSGKTWVARQVVDKFTYVPHDTYGLAGNKAYVKSIATQATNSDKPIVCDTPFSLSEIKEPLSHLGLNVKPVFIIESPETTQSRYEARYRTEGLGQPVMPKGHLTRIETYKQRARELQAPSGTSSEMLDYMKKV